MCVSRRTTRASCIGLLRGWDGAPALSLYWVSASLESRGNVRALAPSPTVTPDKRAPPHSACHPGQATAPVTYLVEREPGTMDGTGARRRNGPRNENGKAAGREKM